MIHNAPQIFDNNASLRLIKYLGALADTPLMNHVNAESEKLQPLFKAAASTFAQLEHVPEYGNDLTQEGLRQTFNLTAAAFGFMCYGTPVMIGESLNARANNFCKENGIDINLDDDAVVPTTETYKSRMFKTARFGFYSLPSQTDQDAYEKRIIVPFYAVADDFFHKNDAQKVLHAASDLSFWCNHDYFHQMIYTALDSDSFHTQHPEAPAYKYMRINPDELFTLNALRNRPIRLFEYEWQADILSETFNMSGNIEPWAMRFHREVLATMNRELGKNSPLWHALDAYLDAYADSALPKMQNRMSDPAIYPQEYAMRLVAFNLVRAEPMNHPIVQHAIQRFRDIVQNCPDSPSELKDPADVFATIYSTKYARTFFGDGENPDMGIHKGYDSSEEYSYNTLSLSARSLFLARKDAQTALEIARNKYDKTGFLRRLLDGTKPNLRDHTLA